MAARKAAPTFARRLGAEAVRRGALDVVRWHPWEATPADLRTVVVLADGATWIWEHVATLFGPERTEIVDWYHSAPRGAVFPCGERAPPLVAAATGRS